MKKSEWNHQRYRIEVKSLFDKMYGGAINPLTPPYRYTVRLAKNREQDTGNNYLLIEWGKDGTFADAKLFGITVLVASAGLAFGLGSKGNLPVEVVVPGLIGTATALIGMVAGRKIRNRLSLEVFRRWVLSALIILGLVMVSRAAGLT